MKKSNYYIYCLFLVVIVVLFILISNQYKDKRKYEEYISNKLNDDFHTLINTINENDRLYDDIISNNRVTGEQSKILMISNEKISNIIQEYRALALNFNKRKEDYSHSKSSLNAYEITRLFYDWNAEAYNNSYNEELDAKKQQNINISKALNSSWLDITNKLYSVHFELNKNNWLNLLDDLEKKTLNFLSDSKLLNIKDTWN